MPHPVALLLGALSCTSPPTQSIPRRPVPVSLPLPEVAHPEDPCAGLPAADGFDHPVGAPDGDGYVDAQPFGGLVSHLGADLNAVTGGNSDYGDPVHAIADGKVVHVTDHRGGWGLVVRVVHRLDEAHCIESLYAHLAESTVEPAQRIARGERLGSIGDANGVYTAHLHVEVRGYPGRALGAGYGVPDSHVDPMAFIEARRPVTRSGHPR